MSRHCLFQPETFKSSQFQIRAPKKDKQISIFQDNNKYQNAENYQNDYDLNQESNKQNYYQYSNDFEQENDDFEQENDDELEQENNELEQKNDDFEQTNNEQLNDPKIFDGKKNFFSNNRIW